MLYYYSVVQSSTVGHSIDLIKKMEIVALLKQNQIQVILLIDVGIQQLDNIMISSMLMGQIKLDFLVGCQAFTAREDKKKDSGVIK